MAQPARKSEAEDYMHDWIARLEEKTEHLQKDVTRIEHKIDNKIEPKLDALAEGLAALRLEMKDLELKMKDNFAKLMNSRWADKVWWLAIAAALLGVMARGFKWI